MEITKQTSPEKLELKDAGRVNLPESVLDFAVTAAGDAAWAACTDGIYKVDLATAKSEKVAQHESFVSGIALVDGDRRLVSAGYDGVLQFREISRVQPDSADRVHSFWSWDMAVSADRKLVASVTGQYLAGSYEYKPAATDEPTVKVFDAITGEVKCAFHMLPSVQAVAFDPTGRFVAAGNLMGDLAVWNLETKQQVAAWRTDAFTSWGLVKSNFYVGGIFALSFAPDGESLYAAGFGPMSDPMAANGLQRWHRFAWKEEPSKLIQQIDDSKAGQGLMETLAWHPSGDFFVMAGLLKEGTWNVGFFRREDGQMIGQLRTGLRVTSAQFSADGNRVYLGGMKTQRGLRRGAGATTNYNGRFFPDHGHIDRFDVQVVTG